MSLLVAWCTCIGVAPRIMKCRYSECLQMFGCTHEVFCMTPRLCGVSAMPLTYATSESPLCTACAVMSDCVYGCSVLCCCPAWAVLFCDALNFSACTVLLAFRRWCHLVDIPRRAVGLWQVVFIHRVAVYCSLRFSPELFNDTEDSA